MMDVLLRRYPGYTVETLLREDAGTVLRLFEIAVACNEAEADHGRTMKPSG